jgi:hypothetical protein
VGGTEVHQRPWASKSRKYILYVPFGFRLATHYRYSPRSTETSASQRLLPPTAPQGIRLREGHGGPERKGPRPQPTLSVYYPNFNRGLLSALDSALKDQIFLVQTSFYESLSSPHLGSLPVFSARTELPTANKLRPSGFRSTANVLRMGPMGTTYTSHESAMHRSDWLATARVRSKSLVHGL